MKSSTIFVLFFVAMLFIAGNEAARIDQGCSKQQLPPYEFKCYKDSDCAPGCLAQFGPRAIPHCDELIFRCYCYFGPC